MGMETEGWLEGCVGGGRGAYGRSSKEHTELNALLRDMPRHAQPALDSILLLQMPKLGDGKDPSCSWVSGI